MFRGNRLSLIVLLSFFILNGCSYSPNVTEIKRSDLPEYNPKDFSQPILVKRDNSGIESEDDLIIQGIWYELHGNYKKSHHFYSILYQRTKNLEYLLRELATALYGGIVSKNIPELEKIVKKNPSNIQLKRVLISFYINQIDNRKAKKIGEELIKESGEAIDYELDASPYILSGEYKRAVELLKIAYNKTYNEDILLKIAILLDDYLHDEDSTIELLEDYRKNHKCSEKICNKLLEIYSKEEIVEPLIDIYLNLYRKTKKEIYATKLVEGYIYTKEFDKAIQFLENDYKNDELLYEVFLAKKDYANAFKVSNRLYNIEKSPRWLAESAMALYEKSRDKNSKKMLNQVVNRFEKAIREGAKDSVYLNYYGYTLIDKDIDIKKGVKIVKDALKEQPNNSYYLDSLAWGYYKLHRCKDAYREMKKVIDIEGLDEEDIAEHWRAIESCNK